MAVERETEAPALAKARTGIQGLDEITNGGLPGGRPTLVCGGPGCGKTLMGVEFLVRGATEFGEPGVFIAFEEVPEELAANVASLGFDLDRLVEEKKLVVDNIYIERSEIEETGEYDLEGLFIRLGLAIDSIGAKRIVLDTLESLLSSFANEFIVRAELRRLFRWLKDRGMTAIITGERGEATLTRQGLEEYVSDCVILLDNRLENQVATRRLRIVKYRGSSHGANEYPFLIDEDGFSVMPLSSIELTHDVFTERVSTGIADLDDMLGGEGFYRGSTVLVSGTAGAGKSSLAAYFADATCRRGERCLYFAFEESPQQIARNMASIGCSLQPWIDKGLLQICSSRPTMHGLEMHLALLHKHTQRFKPHAVILDPVTNFMTIGSVDEVKAMVMRFIDFLKVEGITCLSTSLTGGDSAMEDSEVGISSLMDTWLLLRNLELSGERNRTLYVLKSRGMAHSNQVREFVIGGDGISLAPVYTGVAGVLTGSARISQEASDRAARLSVEQELERRRYSLERKHRALEARIQMLRAEFEAEASEMGELITQDEQRLRTQNGAREMLRASRARGTGGEHANNEENDGRR